MELFLKSAMAVMAVGYTVAAAVADSGVAPVVNGLFLLVNTYLIWKLRGPIEQTHRALFAPRKIIYDADGHPVGTVLDLRGGDYFDPDQVYAIGQESRRHTDT